MATKGHHPAFPSGTGADISFRANRQGDLESFDFDRDEEANSAVAMLLRKVRADQKPG